MVDLILFLIGSVTVVTVTGLIYGWAPMLIIAGLLLCLVASLPSRGRR